MRTIWSLIVEMDSETTPRPKVHLRGLYKGNSVDIKPILDEVYEDLDTHYNEFAAIMHIHFKSYDEMSANDFAKDDVKRVFYSLIATDLAHDNKTSSVLLKQDVIDFVDHKDLIYVLISKGAYWNTKYYFIAEGDKFDVNRSVSRAVFDYEYDFEKKVHPIQTI